MESETIVERRRRLAATESLQSGSVGAWPGRRFRKSHRRQGYQPPWRRGDEGVPGVTAHGDHVMDEVQEYSYRLKFRLTFRQKKGGDFQDWFAELAARAFGPDFEKVRPYGNRGDLKCDGRRVSTRTVFQCYAPYEMKEKLLNAKVEQDFIGACEHWGADMAEWTLVHNDDRGLPASSVQLLHRLRGSRPDVKIEVWAEPALQKLADSLPLSDQQALFGFAPSRTGLETLAMADLQPVIHQLQFMDPEPGEETAQTAVQGQAGEEPALPGCGGPAPTGATQGGSGRGLVQEEQAPRFGRTHCRSVSAPVCPTERRQHTGRPCVCASTAVCRHGRRAGAASCRAGRSVVFFRAVRHFRGSGGGE